MSVCRSHTLYFLFCGAVIADISAPSGQDQGDRVIIVRVVPAWP